MKQAHYGLFQFIMTNTILVVEDDDNLRLTLVDNLEIEGYQVLSVSNLSDAHQLLRDSHVTLVILDIMLPDGSGYDFASELRAKGSKLMILMLTARTLNSDLMEGFSAGADDYMTKPYRLNELLARVQALMSRSQSSSAYPSQECLINGLKVSWEKRMIVSKANGVNSRVIDLTKKEFDLLHLLYLNMNKTLSRDEILNKVWGKGAFVDERTVDNFISVIRKALRLNGSEEFSIRTVRGIGYSLVKNNS